MYPYCVQIHVESNDANIDLAVDAPLLGHRGPGAGPIVIKVFSGIEVTSANAVVPALDIDAADNVTAKDWRGVVNDNNIEGRGGAAGAGDTNGIGGGSAGQAGGPAFDARSANVHFWNTTISGGGGGGGGGGYGESNGKSCTANAGGNGGTGAGSDRTAAGGSSGTAPNGGDGGAGAALGAAGSVGANGSDGGELSCTQTDGGAGGTAGPYARNNANITWEVTGTRNGTTT